MRVQENIKKLENEIVRGLNNIIKMTDSIEGSAAGFFLMGNALFKSGNIDYAEKYYLKAAELKKQQGESDHVVIAKLINIYAEQGVIALVRHNLNRLAEEYEDIDQKPAIAKEIKDAFKSHYNFKGNFKIQLDQVIKQCQEWLNNPDAEVAAPPIIIRDQVILTGGIKEKLDDLLTHQPLELQALLLDDSGIKGYVEEFKEMFLGLSIEMSRVEYEIQQQLTQLKQDVSDKPSKEDITNLRGTISKQIDNLSIQFQMEALTLKDMILMVEARTATQEDVNWINEQLGNTTAKTFEGAQQIILLKNMFYNMEQTVELNMDALRQTVEHKTDDLAQEVESKTNAIYKILEEKANQDDLEYVNSELEKMSSNNYDDAQKIIKLNQLVTNIEYKVEIQEGMIEGFRSYVKQALNNTKASISELFDKMSDLELGNLTEEYLLGFISEVKKHDQLIADLNNDISRINNNDNEKLSVEVAGLMDNYQNQTLEYIEQTLSMAKDQQMAVILRNEIVKVKEELGGEIQNINSALIVTEIYKKAQLSKDFTNLTGNDAIYAKAFVSGMRNYIDVYRIASKEFFTVEEKQFTPEIVSDLLKAIPGIGNTLGTIDKYVNKLYSIKDSETKAQIIKKLKFVDSNFVLQDLELYTAEVALTMIRNKTVAEALNGQQQNIDFVNQITGKVDQIQKEFDSKMDLLKQEIIGVDAVNDENLKEISELAWEHAEIFMQALCRRDGEDLPESLPEFIAVEVFKEAQNPQMQWDTQEMSNYQLIGQEEGSKQCYYQPESLAEFIDIEVFKKMQNNPNIVANQLRSEIYRIGVEEESKQSDYQPKKIIQPKAKGSNCTVFSVTTIKYDNQLLNHPDLLNELSNKSADIYNLNKIIDLSLNLSPSLINEAIQYHDIDLLLGGVMSLDSSEY